MIIGAGSSGIATAKVFAERGVPFDCFEKSDRVGGNWVFENSNEMSACYRGLNINTSKTRMAYSDFPMPEDYPDFPHHTQIAAYFDRYVDHFDVRRRITFRTAVTHASPAGEGWRVTLEGGETREYDALVVANGHHWDPRLPDPPFPGHFDGVTMHSHAYVDPEPMRDRRVLVLGIGNSAMDIAVEVSAVARRTVLASRRGAWVVPKYLFGRPLDTIITSPHLPFEVRRRIGEGLLAATVGDMPRYGLPEPDHRFGSAHPTISGRILDRLTHGAVTYRPNIARLDGETVHFVDGSSEPFDVIVYCTGYKVTFPFFDPSLVSAPDNDLPLFRRVFHPRLGALYFVGLLQPLGALMPLAEAQSHWIAEHLLGEYELPAPAAIERDMREEREAMFARYVASARHTMQVDFDDYLLALGRERAAGRRRARVARRA